MPVLHHFALICNIIMKIILLSFDFLCFSRLRLCHLCILLKRFFFFDEKKQNQQQTIGRYWYCPSWYVNTPNEYQNCNADLCQLWIYNNNNVINFKYFEEIWNGFEKISTNWFYYGNVKVIWKPPWKIVRDLLPVLKINKF